MFQSVTNSDVYLFIKYSCLLFYLIRSWSSAGDMNIICTLLIEDVLAEQLKTTLNIIVGAGMVCLFKFNGGLLEEL